MYKAEFSGVVPKITPVEIEKESKEFVWIKGESYRQLKRSEFTAFFKTYEMAFNFLDDKFAYKAKIAKEEYENFLKTVSKIEPYTMEENPIVKYSSCQKCKGYVRQAIRELMTKASIKQFNGEVSEYKLTVNELSLIEFRKLNIPFCGCKI